MTPTYNPAPQILEEAVVNEWPGQAVGLFLSIGTGKRPVSSQHSHAEWWEGFAGGLGSFAEAKRKLIAKIEGCEKTHQEMMSKHLPRRAVNPDNYLRLNVEVGVGEFGMNEWHRLAEISNNTQAYLNIPKVKACMGIGASQMAKVDSFRRQQQAYHDSSAPVPDTPSPFRANYRPKSSGLPPPRDFAVELPGSAPIEASTSIANHARQRPVPSIPRHVPESSAGSHASPPLIPPKTPLPSTKIAKAQRHGSAGATYNRPASAVPSSVARAQTMRAPLPYPDTDGPPPVVNMARKPHFIPQ